MKKRISLFAIFAAIVFALSPIQAHAHPGKTDSAGGHQDRSTGSYHFHHGYSAHDHYDINGDGNPDCPYDFKNNEKKSYVISNTKKSSATLSPTVKEASGYKDGYAAGKEFGLEIGKNQGYALGWKDAEEKYREDILDSTIRAYAVSAVIGFAALAAVCSVFNQTKKKAENDLRREIGRLKRELNRENPNVPKNEPVTRSESRTALALKSSAVSSVAFTSKGLLVTFTTGKKFIYYNVPKETYKEMISSPSIGRYYQQKIKDHFPYLDV